MNVNADSTDCKHLQIVRKIEVRRAVRPVTLKQDPELEDLSQISERGDTTHFPPPTTHLNKPYRVTSHLSAQEMDAGASMPKLKYRDGV